MELASSSSISSSPTSLAVQSKFAKEKKGSVRVGGGSRRAALLLLLASPAVAAAPAAEGKTKSRNPYDERRLLEQNRKIQEANRAPEDFPNFVREGFDVKVLISDNYIKRDSGLIYQDIKVGEGDCPKDGQQVTFHYVGYNEAGRRIDSTYIQGSPAKIRLGNKTLVPGKDVPYPKSCVEQTGGAKIQSDGLPDESAEIYSEDEDDQDTPLWRPDEIAIGDEGFEEGIRDMKPGGKRRIIIPPELGPPVGPSTFFSAKQFEVFDVELLAVQDCQRRTIAFYSDVICN